MKLEIVRETPKPEPPPIKEVVIRLTAKEAVLLRKLAGRSSKDKLRDFGVEGSEDSPAVSAADVQRLMYQLYSALPGEGAL